MFTSTLEARNTHVGAINTGSMLFREYLKEKKGYLNESQRNKTRAPLLSEKQKSHECRGGVFRRKQALMMALVCSPGIETLKVDSCRGDDLLSEFQVFAQGLNHCHKRTN